eukprot:Hpha_TRINITY_DN16868_c2_g1::TRINITY_DN16868_c2_g1_i1::g.152725::m.152725
MAPDAEGYLQKHGVPERLEVMLRDLTREQPADIASWLQRWVSSSWASVSTGGYQPVTSSISSDFGGVLRFCSQQAASGGGGGGGGGYQPGGGGGGGYAGGAPVTPGGAGSPPRERGQWREHITPGAHQRAGRPFYVNTATGEKRWDPPDVFRDDAPAAQPAPMSAPGGMPGVGGGVSPRAGATGDWEAVRVDNGRYFWHNRITREKTWDCPPGCVPPAPRQDVPDEWTIHSCEKPGRGLLYFWMNKITGEKTWSQPPGAPAPPPGGQVLQQPSPRGHTDPAHHPHAPGGGLPSAGPPAGESDWTVHHSPEGRCFWYHRITKEKTWSRPPGAPDAPAEPAVSDPSEWEMLTANDGRPFWFNRRTQEKTWQKPTGLQDGGAPPGVQGGALGGGGEMPLPADWKEFKAGDRVFYHNARTGEKTWTRPTGEPQMPPSTRPPW